MVLLSYSACIDLRKLSKKIVLGLSKLCKICSYFGTVCINFLHKITFFKASYCFELSFFSQSRVVRLKQDLSNQRKPLAR